MARITLDFTLSCRALEAWFQTETGVKDPAINVLGAGPALALFLTKNGVNAEVARSMIGHYGYLRDLDTFHVCLSGEGDEFFKACRCVERLRQSVKSPN